MALGPRPATEGPVDFNSPHHVWSPHPLHVVPPSLPPPTHPPPLSVSGSASPSAHRRRACIASCLCSHGAPLSAVPLFSSPCSVCMQSVSLFFSFFCSPPYRAVVLFLPVATAARTWPHYLLPPSLQWQRACEWRRWPRAGLEV